MNDIISQLKKTDPVADKRVTDKGGVLMTSRQAIQVLMLSPIYFKLNLLERKQLIRHYCKLFKRAEKRSSLRY
jgi:hypothetical protein